MQQFEMFDPSKPEPQQYLLRRFDNPMGGEDEYFFVKQDDHLLVHQQHFHTYPATAGAKAGATKLFRGQFEMPLPGMRWFIDVIEQKFFKSPDEGGLPAHKLSYEEIVAGEDLHIMRTMGGGDRPGYVITNGSRRTHYDNTDLQELNLSDRWLFQDGLMDYFKELADKYEQGKL